MSLEKSNRQLFPGLIFQLTFDVPLNIPNSTKIPGFDAYASAPNTFDLSSALSYSIRFDTHLGPPTM